MEVYSVQTIADWLINKSHDEGNPVTQLRLQKILYFIQGHYLSFKDGLPLFRRDFEAWRYGPVLRPLYDRFKMHGNDEIPKQETADIACPETEEFLNGMYAIYGVMGSTYLIGLSHDPNGPWAKHYNKNLHFNDEIIPKSEMKVYFDQFLKAEAVV
ncbi:MAG: Panacea domain-containing protein [Spirochaetaceae bacterium]